MQTHSKRSKGTQGKMHCHADELSPAHQRGDDDTPGSAAAVGTWLLWVWMGMWGVVTLAPPAAEPEGVEEQEEEVQTQAKQCHGTEEQDGLQGDNGQHEIFKDLI